jgi:hypothetical protein
MIDNSLSLQSFHFIISCEGTAEEVIVRKLLAANAFVFPGSNIIEITRKRKAKEIQDYYLNYDYDWPVCIVRIHDSKSERFKLGSLYVNRFSVKSFTTHPEIEVLAIIKEDAWKDWKKSQKKPSLFCKEDLHLSEIKTCAFPEKYWDADSIALAAREYKKLSQIVKGELCLADLIRDDFI